jgi:hypothetical protein
MTSPNEIEKKALFYDVYVANSDDIHLVAAPDEDAARGVARRILRKGVTDYSVIRSEPWETGPAHFTWQESDGRIEAEVSETDKLRARISALEAKLEEAEGRIVRAMNEARSLQAHEFDVLSQSDVTVISTRLHNIRTALKEPSRD